MVTKIVGSDSALTDVLPKKIRKQLYKSYTVVGVAIGATQVGFSTAAGFGSGVDPTPHWLMIVLAVYAYLAVPVGALAVSNMDHSGDDVNDDPAHD